MTRASGIAASDTAGRAVLMAAVRPEADGAG